MENKEQNCEHCQINEGVGIPKCANHYTMENKDWKKQLEKVSGYRFASPESQSVIKSFIESLLKSKQEEIEKAIDGMKGYIPHIPAIDPSLGELTDQDIGFVEHINGQLLFKREVKPIISNILK